MSITHAYTATGTDAGDSRVSVDRWNEEHVDSTTIVVRAIGGTSDDAPNIRAAVAAATPGTTIYLPDDLYLLKSGVDDYGAGSDAAIEVHTNNIRFRGKGGTGDINNVLGPDSTVIQSVGFTGTLFRWVADEGTNVTDEDSMIRMGGIDDCFVWGNATALRCLEIRGGVRDLTFRRSTFSHATGTSIVGGETVNATSQGWHATFNIDFDRCAGSTFVTSGRVVWLVKGCYNWTFRACNFASGTGYVIDLQGCDDIYFVQCMARSYSGGKTLRIWPRDPAVSPTPLASSIIAVQSFGFDNIEAPAATNQLNAFNGQYLMLGVPTTDAGRFGAATHPSMGAGRHIWYLDDQGRHNFRRDLRIAQHLYDDFMTGDTASGSIGQLGWLLTGGFVAAFDATAVSGRSVISLNTNATGGSACAIGLRAANNPVDPASSFIEEWLVQFKSLDSDTTHRIGLAGSYTADPPTNGIYLEKLTTDTDIYAVTRSGGTQTRTVLITSPSTTTWYRVTILRQSATVIGFVVGDVENWATTVNHSANVPTAALQPFASVKTAVGTSKFMYLDAFQHTVNGMTR